MDTFANILKSFGAQWSRLSLNQRIMVGTLFLAMVFSTFFLYRQAQDDYDILYSNLSLADAAAMTAKLKEAKEPFRLADGGTTIMVPRPKRNELVLETANELSSEQTINLSQIPPVLQGDVQKEWIKKLNTDAIAEILRSIRGIKNAQVIVSQPEKSVFTEQQQSPSASVMLMVEPGFRMREEQIKVIKNLVAHAVPGLKAEDVAIADNSGNPLEGPGINGGTSDVDSRRKQFEEETAKKVLSILSPLVGKDNAVVSVSTVINFDQAQSKIHRVIPTGGSEDSPTGLTVSTQEQVEEYTGGAKPPEGGVAGVQANSPQTFQATEGKKEENNYKLTKRTSNYTNSEEDKSIIHASGNIERMTVAVVLNKVLTAKETEEIRELVENAAGIDMARGDSVDIKGFQFSQVGDPKEKSVAEVSKSAQEQAFILQIASVVSVVILGLAALFIFYSLFKRPAVGELVEEDEDEEIYMPRYIPEPRQQAELPQIPMLEMNTDPEIEMKREALNTLVEQDPNEAARVLVSYIKGS